MLWRGLGVIAIVALVLVALMSPVRAQDDAQATIEALQTRVAELTTPTVVPRQPTATPSASSRTPTPEAGSRYPPAVAEIAAGDSATGCDEVAWAREADELELEASRSSPFVACVGGGTYTMACFDLTEFAAGTFFSPSSGDLWLGCLVQVGNGGSTDIDVNPLYFSLVTAENERMNTSFEPMAAFPNAETLPAGSVPPDQYVEGWVYFIVNHTDEQPFRVEIAPLTFSLGEQARGVVIIDELLDLNDL